MPSAAEPSRAKPKRRRLADTFEIWNRKLHYYLGLYLLFFLWLFAFTGLLLNHPEWTFQEFWPQRRQSSETRLIQAPPDGGDLAQAHDLLRQLGSSGEIEWTATRADPARLVSAPAARATSWKSTPTSEPAKRPFSAST